jgi:hypothetical protein
MCTYALGSLISQLILLGHLVAVLVLWDILCDGMVGVRLVGVGCNCRGTKSVSAQVRDQNNRPLGWRSITKHHPE